MLRTTAAVFTLWNAALAYLRLRFGPKWIRAGDSCHFPANSFSSRLPIKNKASTKKPKCNRSCKHPVVQNFLQQLAHKWCLCDSSFLPAASLFCACPPSINLQQLWCNTCLHVIPSVFICQPVRQAWLSVDLTQSYPACLPVCLLGRPLPNRFLKSFTVSAVCVFFCVFPFRLPSHIAELPQWLFLDRQKWTPEIKNDNMQGICWCCSRSICHMTVLLVKCQSLVLCHRWPGSSTGCAKVKFKPSRIVM